MCVCVCPLPLLNHGYVSINKPSSYTPPTHPQPKHKHTHSEYFKQQTDEGGQPKFAAFDGEGFPTQDGGGEVLSKGAEKRLRKEWDAHKKLHEKVVGGGGK